LATMIQMGTKRKTLTLTKAPIKVFIEIIAAESPGGIDFLFESTTIWIGSPPPPPKGVILEKNPPIKNMFKASLNLIL